MNSKNIKADKQTSADAIQGIVVVENKCKRNTLKILLEKEKEHNAIVFCNRKREAGLLYRHLSKQNFSLVEIFKGMPQEMQEKRLKDFKDDKIKLLVCSDTAVKELGDTSASNVFNFDVPVNAKDYIRRTKHAGQGENIGKIFTIATPNDTSYLEKIAKLNKKEIVVIEHEGIEQVSLIRPDEKQEEKPEQKNTQKPQQKNKQKNKQQDKQQDKQQKCDSSDVSHKNKDVKTTENKDEKPPENKTAEVQPDNKQNSAQANNRTARNKRRTAPAAMVEAMTHAENVKGFGDHTPSFMLKKVAASRHANKIDADMEQSSSE